MNYFDYKKIQTSLSYLLLGNICHCGTPYPFKERTLFQTDLITIIFKQQI